MIDLSRETCLRAFRQIRAEGAHKSGCKLGPESDLLLALRDRVDELETEVQELNELLSWA